MTSIKKIEFYKWYKYSIVYNYGVESIQYFTITPLNIYRDIYKTFSLYFDDKELNQYIGISYPKYNPETLLDHIQTMNNAQLIKVNSDQQSKLYKILGKKLGKNIIKDLFNGINR